MFFLSTISSNCCYNSFYYISARGKALLPVLDPASCTASRCCSLACCLVLDAGLLDPLNIEKNCFPFFRESALGTSDTLKSELLWAAEKKVEGCLEGLKAYRTVLCAADPVPSRKENCCILKPFFNISITYILLVTEKY
jgi:hypothetical protein